MKAWIQLVTSALLAGALTACGGGSTRVADGGIGGTGISRGSISSFGSVVVNGQRFETASAAFRLDGLVDDERALRVGYVARLEADFDDATAQVVHFVPNVAGAVDSNSVDPTTGVGRLTVLGQTVVVRDSTVVDGVADSAADFAPDQRVLVSGFRNTAGEIVASYIGAGAQVPAEDWVSGRVVGTPDSAQQTFRIGALTIDYTETAEFPADGVSAGDPITVRGSEQPSGELRASAVRTFTPIGGGVGSVIQVSGIIDDDEASQDIFELAGERVDVGDARIINGTRQDLTDDAAVIVRGERVEEDLIRAATVEVLPDEEVDIEATISGADPAAGTVSFFDGELVVHVDARTRLRDDLQDDDRLTLDELAPGQCVEIDGYVDRGADGTLDPGDRVVALKLEREEADDCDGVELDGPIAGSDPDGQSMQLLGLTVETDADTEFDGFSAPADFFAALKVGTLVAAEWPAGENPIDHAAEDIEIEADDDGQDEDDG